MASSSGAEPPTKKPNMDNGDGVVDLPSFDQFVLNEVLGNDIDRKLAFLYVKRKEGGGQDNAVVILDKKPFCADDFAALLDKEKTKFEPLMQNDIYSAFEVELPSKNSALKATFIYPASSKHIEKYRYVGSMMVSETSSDYQRITLPYITQNQFSIQWVDNILNGTAEKERIFYSNSDFLLAPDLKWDGTRLENLYVTAICRQRGIKSIRDLNDSHLPLLESIHLDGAAAIISKYGVPASRLRIFVHYQPSYYHFHVHFVHVNYDAAGTTVGKAHLLTDIIDNIKMIPDYYQRKTLHYQLKTNDPLLAKFQDAQQ